EGRPSSRPARSGQRIPLKFAPGRLIPILLAADEVPHQHQRGGVLQHPRRILGDQVRAVRQEKLGEVLASLLDDQRVQLARLHRPDGVDEVDCQVLLGLDVHVPRPPPRAPCSGARPVYQARHPGPVAQPRSWKCGTVDDAVEPSGDAMFTGVKVFSATKAKEREELGENVTRWIKSNSDLEIVDKVVTQSSDNEFHCYSLVIFYKQKSQ